MKKFKLFTTIASLCLAVALMAFGVYAAQDVSVGVTGNIAVTVSADVKAKVTLVDTIANVTDATKGTSLVGSTGKTLFESADNAAGTPTTTATTHAYGDLTFTAVDTTKAVEFTYTIKVVNKAASTDYNKIVKVEFTTAETSTHTTKNYGTDGYSVTVTGDLANGGVVSGLGDENAKTYIVTIKINPNYSISQFDIGTTIKLTMVNSAE